MSEPLDERIIKLEELVTHQQHMLETLSGVLLELRSQLDFVDARSQNHLERMQWMIERRMSPDLPDEEKPPHY